MTRAALLGFAALLLLAACGKSEPGADRERYAPARGVMGYNDERAQARPEQKRYIAVSHQLLIETGEDALPKAWEETGKLCQSLNCEILSSSITNRTQDSPPSASLSLRIVPEDLPKLFDQLGRAGTVVTHTTDSEDKTATVIDVEARLRNLTEFRDRLRKMLATRSGTLKDVVEVERELARVQSELDSLATQRKVLANQTEKVAVRVEFQSRRSATGTGVFTPISRAWQGAAYIFSESVAALFIFLVAALPWMVIVVPLGWLIVRLVRRRLRRRTESKDWL